jgi:hypothetical protein
VYRSPNFSTFLPTLIFSGEKWYFIMVLVHVCLITNDNEYLCLCLLTIHLFLDKCLSKSFDIIIKINNILQVFLYWFLYLCSEEQSEGLGRRAIFLVSNGKWKTLKLLRYQANEEWNKLVLKRGTPLKCVKEKCNGNFILFSAFFSFFSPAFLRICLRGYRSTKYNEIIVNV